jgi:predicted MarR family transcription regulator
MMATATLNLNTKLSRALELLGGSIDPDIEESYASMEERILAQAMENVEKAERRLREIQRLVGDLVGDYEVALA